MSTEKGKAVPAGPRNGFDYQKQLSSNFRSECYFRFAKSASADRP